MTPYNWKQLACRPLFILAAAIIVTAAYLPGLNGPFVFDDHVHLVSNSAVAPEVLNFSTLRRAAQANETDPLRRPLASISFALNYYLAGGTANTLPFKMANLLIHLINTGLVYWLTLLLFKQLAARPGFHRTRLHDWLPALVATTWALHPLQLTSVLYVVQRMNSLAALFVLLGLITFMYGRLRVQQSRRGGYTVMGLGLFGGLVLGMMCKENALLLPLFALVIECVFFRRKVENTYHRVGLKWFYSATVFILCVFSLVWLLNHPNLILGSYAFREFSLSERLLTETRILWFYASLLPLPSPQRLSLFHDDIPLSTGLLTPWTTLPSMLGLLSVIVIAIAYHKKHPLLSFSILWFLTGHLLESTVIGLEIAHEHRNYLPSFGPILALTYGLARLFERIRMPAVSIAIFMLVLSTLAFSTYTRAKVWASEEGIAVHLLRHHSMSARAHLMRAELNQIRGDAIGAIRHYKRASELAPHETGYLLRLALIVATTDVTQLSKRQQRNRDESQSARTALPRFIEVAESGQTVRLQLSEPILVKIAQGLATNPVNSRVVEGLGELAGCVIEDQKRCGSLYPTIIAWYKLAFPNPRTSPKLRNDMVIGLGRVYFAYRDYAEALKVVQRARALDPANPNFVVMAADAYFHLDELDRSEKLLLSLNDPSLKVTSTLREQAETLSALIQERRRQTASK